MAAAGAASIAAGRIEMIGVPFVDRVPQRVRPAEGGMGGDHRAVHELDVDGVREQARLQARGEAPGDLPAVDGRGDQDRGGFGPGGRGGQAGDLRGDEIARRVVGLGRVHHLGAEPAELAGERFGGARLAHHHRRRRAEARGRGEQLSGHPADGAVVPVDQYKNFGHGFVLESRVPERCPERKQVR